MIKTFRQLRKFIPDNWLDADIAIDSGIGSPEKIYRVSLHKNDNGKRIILIHEKRIEIWTQSPPPQSGDRDTCEGEAKRSPTPGQEEG